MPNDKAPRFPFNTDPRLCSYCGRGFMVDLPSIYIKRTTAWLPICPGCLYKPGIKNPELGHIRRIIRRLVFSDTGTQEGLT